MLESCEHIYTNNTTLEEDGILVNKHLWFYFIGVYVGFFGVYLSCVPSKKEYEWKDRLIALEDFRKDYLVPDDFILVNMTEDVAQEARNKYKTISGYFCWLDTSFDNASAYAINPYGELHLSLKCIQKHILPALLVPTNLMRLK